MSEQISSNQDSTNANPLPSENTAMAKIMETGSAVKAFTVGVTPPADLLLLSQLRQPEAITIDPPTTPIIVPTVSNTVSPITSQIQDSTGSTQHQDPKVP